MLNFIHVNVYRCEMTDKSFFKPTQLYKEYMILDLIEKNKDITQRELANHLGIAVSMVNLMLVSLEKNHLLKRKKASSKVVDYVLTKQGFERKKVLNMTYLSSTQKLYESAKENIENFLVEIKNKGYKDILLYGAGEVSEILLNTLKSNKSLDLNCNAIIDDDTLKIGNHILDIPIIDIKDIDLYKNEGILISSYKHKDNIIKKLINIHYDSNNIINFFE